MALVLLPFGVWLLLFAHARLWRARRGAAPDWAVEFVWACLAWGLAVTVITEGLSALRGLTWQAAALVWGTLCLALLAALPRALRRAPGLFRAARPRPDGLLLGAAVVVALTGLTAWVAPPNNMDAFLYHMSRVMHWIQNRSVDFYATHIIWQLFHPPWTEYAVLQLQLLSRGDRFANGVQWFSMVGSLVAVALVARELGANGRGRVIAIVLCATIPMGILQASTVKNDYTVAFWLVCLAYFCLRLTRRASAGAVFGAGLALGLALLTKATAYVFALPFLLWAAAAALRESPRRAAPALVLIALIALAFNVSHYIRNQALFGAPLGPEIIGEDGRYRYTNETLSPRVTLLNAVKNLTLHLGLPWEAANEALDRGVTRLAVALDLDVNDPAISYQGGRFRFDVPRTNTFEAFTGNPLHLVLNIAAAFGLALNAAFWRSPGRRALLFAGCVGLGFLGFVTYVKWQVWNTHHHLPLFVLAAPVTGLALGRLRPWAGRGIAALALLAALPWVLANEIRPLVPWPGVTPYQSILTRPRTELYFNTAPELEAPYRAATAVVAQSGCAAVGLSVGLEDAAEYLFWVLLREAGAQPRLEHYDFDWDHSNPSKRLAAPFEPCAVLNVWYDFGLAAKYAEQIEGEIYPFEPVYAVVRDG